MSASALLASNAILLALIVALAWLFHRRLARVEREGDKMTALYIEQLQQQISHQQRDLLHLAKRLDGTALARDPAQPSPYTQAIELIRQGVSAAEVAERCGISRSEAELILSLYRNNSTL